MATHSSVLAWRIPGTGEPGGLPSMGVARSQTRLERLGSSSSDYFTGLDPLHFQLDFRIMSVFIYKALLGL